MPLSLDKILRAINEFEDAANKFGAQPERERYLSLQNQRRAELIAAIEVALNDTDRIAMEDTRDALKWNIGLLHTNTLTAAAHSKCPCGCHPKSEPWYCQACNELHEHIEKLAVNASGRSADKEAQKHE